jgi:fatty-acyl-CoA synthase
MHLALTAKEVDAFLRGSDKLADYKIPAQYEFVEQLPGSETGEIQKHALLKSIKDRGF